MQAITLTGGALLAALLPACASVPAPSQPAALPPSLGVAPSPAEPSAFESLARAVGDAKVVGLGESTHDGAASFEAKVEIVRYLHESEGFNHLIFEGGLFSCREANRVLQAGGSAAEATRLCLDGDPCNQGAYPLFEYAQQVIAAGGTLTISGMDPQLTGAAPRELLASRLRAELGEAFTPDHEGSVQYFHPPKGTDAWDVPRTEEQHWQHRMHIRDLLAVARGQQKVGSYWPQVLEGLLFLDEDHWDFQKKGKVSSAMGSLRDQHMGQIVLGLLSRNPQDRFIVSAATVHLTRQSTSGDVTNAGQWLADELGDKYYALGVSATKGEVGWSGREERCRLSTLEPGMVEYGALGGDTGPVFMGRQDLEPFEGVASHLVGCAAEDTTANWSQVLDGAWVIDEDRPLERHASCLAATGR